jgi:hypothetical protein
MTYPAPIRRAVEMALMICCATSVSTVGTPVMSMIANWARAATISVSKFSMTICARALSSVPMSGKARIESHKWTTDVDSSSSSWPWRLMMAVSFKEVVARIL